jgi:D-3-phosphoglycerate dehydrogenase
MAANQVRNFLDSGTIKNSVNFPDCEMGPMSHGSTRILVANRNVPNMVGQMTSILAENKINIADMLNKHRGDIAFNIIDVDGIVGDVVVSALSKIEGVIMTRLIHSA